MYVSGDGGPGDQTWEDKHHGQKLYVRDYRVNRFNRDGTYRKRQAADQSSPDQAEYFSEGHRVALLQPGAERDVVGVGEGGEGGFPVVAV